MEFPELADGGDWARTRAGFAWTPPDRFNFAEMTVERWARATPDKIALIDLDDRRGDVEWSYRMLSRRSSQLANALAAKGVARGDRVGVLLPQSAAALLTWLAAAKLGAVVTPLFTLFGEEGLAYRIGDSGCVALVTDAANMPKVAAIRGALPDLRHVICFEGPSDGADGFDDLLDQARDAAATSATGPDDPLLISYTSGTTGPPKGALHGHRVLAAHAIGGRTIYDFMPREGDVMWTPADWAWLGGSMNAMTPALYFGVPLIAYRMAKFDPEEAFDLMARRAVRVAFLPPTALKLMRSVRDPRRFGADLRAVGSAGEVMGAEVMRWGREAFGLTINEFYGQTECNMLIGNNARLMRPKPGSMGLPMPGHDAAVLRPDMTVARRGDTGELAIRAPDPGMFLGYWNKPEKTAEKVRRAPDGSRWMLTGDEAMMDGEGYFHFSSRTDDVITSSGYRVGPSEIEECLTGHPAVLVAAVVGVPDPVRTEVIQACVKIAPDAAPTAETAAALIAHVKTRLSPHLAPSDVHFIEEIPMTATGKVLRRELRARLIAERADR